MALVHVAAAFAAYLCASYLKGCGDGGKSPATQMPSVRLASGAEMPVLSAGVWQYNDSEAEAAVTAALTAGFTHIDTAHDYQNQRGVGKAIKNSGKARDALFITTKVPGCGLQGSSGLSAEACRNDTASMVNEDLEQLGLTYLDLVLIHFPPCAGDNGSAAGPPDSSCFKAKTGCSGQGACDLVKAQWDVLTEAYNNKRVRSIGVSNYCQGCFACLETAQVKPMVNQVQYHVGMGPDPQGFKSFAEQKNFVLQAWSPLGSGGHGSDALLKGNLTTSIGKKHGKSSVQVALKWITTHGLAVATKSSKLEHLKEDLDIFDFELSKDDMAELDAADFAAKDTPSFLCSDARQEQIVI
eukprot:TRINITY_DN91346_c0_g1_i1.p1 TRINITY_DN91346_c0_g1~~TRINITY_DN91346_c0_g1_i1.p1  ORF type:complete len:374 (-),score=89.03 TRINITY_DN91346_c0_g1_i1:75-1136(-)